MFKLRHLIYNLSGFVKQGMTFHHLLEEVAPVSISHAERFRMVCIIRNRIEYTVGGAVEVCQVNHLVSIRDSVPGIELLLYLARCVILRNRQQLFEELLKHNIIKFLHRKFLIFAINLGNIPLTDAECFICLFKFRIHITNMNFGAFRELKDKLLSIPGINSVEQRKFSNGELNADVVLDKNTEELAGILYDLGYEVTGMTGSTIEAVRKE